MFNYDERYDIRIARQGEVDDIVTFIKNHWNENHIFVKDKAFFKWMYDGKGGQFNFMIARERSDNSLQAIWGFVLSSLTKGDITDVSGSMWKVRSDTKNIPFLGCELINRLSKFVKYRDHLGSGLNPRTAVLFYKNYFNRFVEKMAHYYILNETIDTYQIAKVPSSYNRTVLCQMKTNSTITNNTIEIEELQDISMIERSFDLKSTKAIPHKDAKYLHKRYFAHPYYKYLAWGIKRNGSSAFSGILFMREVQANAKKALRIIDFLGDTEVFAFIGNALHEYIVTNKYEYVDLYCVGVPETSILEGGFIKRDNDNIIIPNYFEPFEQKNVDIWAQYQHKGVLVFKGDGDQDRPNIAR